jgi:hypothetical protein
MSISDFGGLAMSATFENLFGLQFCQYKCGTYIGFSDDEMSSDGQSHKPLEATTGNVHECPNEGWSKQKTCFGCGQHIQFHNSHVYYNGEKKAKIRFDSPGVKHSCTQQTYDYESNSEEDPRPNEKQKQQDPYQEPQDYEKIWEQFEKQQEQRQKQREQQRQKQREQQFRKICDKKVIEAYAVFGLNHNATLEQIKSTFRKFALRYHPDKNKSPTATAMMVKINDAYEEITRWKENHD